MAFFCLFDRLLPQDDRLDHCLVLHFRSFIDLCYLEGDFGLWMVLIVLSKAKSSRLILRSVGENPALVDIVVRADARADFGVSMMTFLSFEAAVFLRSLIARHQVLHSYQIINFDTRFYFLSLKI